MRLRILHRNKSGKKFSGEIRGNRRAESQNKLEEEKWEIRIGRVWLTDEYSLLSLPAKKKKKKKKKPVDVNPVDEFAEEGNKKLFGETSRRLRWQDKSNVQ